MEKLYNNIILESGFRNEPNDASNVPYLQSPPEVINVTIGRQLFVDDFLIAETDLAPTYHKAEKFHGNPIFIAETPWEIAQSPVACPKSGGVWYDEKEKIFKMWYEAGWLHQMCYATSQDGIHWHRPALDLEPGTNKILTYPYDPEKFHGDVHYFRPDSTTVWIDDDAPPQERYKMFMRNPLGKVPGIVAVSGDGIHFEKFKFTENIHDRSTMFYNPFRKKWVYSVRDHGNPRAKSKRTRNYRECDDYLTGANWTDEECQHWMETDELDRPNPYIGFNPQLYNVDCVGYESIMLGMFQVMHGPENDVCGKYGVPKITELIPMYSRNGYHFSRPCRESIIHASIHQGTWDRGYVQSVGGVTIINGDELWIYYAGFAGDEAYTDSSWLTNGMYRNGATGIAKLRRDGFVSMDGKGSLTTRKLEMQGKKRCFVNAKGSVSVTVLDSDGAVLAVSSVFCGDSTNAELDFAGFDLATLNNKVFRLHFQVEGQLFAFGFADEKGEFGGARAAGVVE